MHDLVPIVMFISMFGMIFGIVYIRSRENMAMLEKGLDPRTRDKETQVFVYLRYGLLLVGAGIGLLSAYLIDGNISHRAITPGGQAYDNDNPALYFALVGIGGGIGLIISYLIEKKWWNKKRG